MSSCAFAEPGVHFTTSLEAQLRRRLGSRVRDLRVVVGGEGVVLEGRALTFHAKQLAQHAAMQLADLPVLTNNIQVR